MSWSLQRVVVIWLWWWWCCVDETCGQTNDYVGKADKRVEGKTTLNELSCLGGVGNCPDKGEFKYAGGNVTLTVLEMKNLPDLDGFGLAGLETDAYIRARIGQDFRTSGTIRNSLNPVWPPCNGKGCRGRKDIVRDLNFGMRRAGTPISIEVYDEDSGLEFSDDWIATVSVNVIYCSAYTSYIQKTPNEEEDSVWQMPNQPMCVEEAWVPLQSGKQCVDEEGILSTTVPCLKIRMTAIPFQMRVEEVYLTGVTVNGGMAGYYPESYGRVYGRVYSGSDSRLMNYFRFQRAKGGILVRSSSRTLNNKGNTTLISKYGYSPYARVTTNYDAEMFVFRRVSDWKSQKLEWLGEKFGWVETRDLAQLVGVKEDFRAVSKNFSAHPINRYGDAKNGGIVTGANIRMDNNDTASQMYFIVLVPKESFDDLPPVYSKEFSRGEFFTSLIQFGVIFALFLIMVVQYVKKMNWRLDRVQSYLLSFVEGDDNPQKSAMATLFVCYNDSKNNIEFRRNLFYATQAVNVCITIPFFVLLTWSIATVSTVTPPAVGFAIFFIGSACLLATYGIFRWKVMGWRMTSSTLMSFFLAFLCAFLFLFSATFVDPNVYNGGNNVDFFSLSAIFFVLNMMPMIWLTFTNDSKMMKSLKQVLAVVTASKKVGSLKKKFKNLGSMGLKLATVKGDVQRERGDRKQSAFHCLVGDHYSIVSSIPGFELSDILQNAFINSANTQKKFNILYYGIAIFTLVVYSIVSFYATDYPTQGIGFMFTILLLDSTILMLHRGNLSWSAGYIVFLMGACRSCLVAFSGKFWILGESMLFMIFGTALCIEIVGKNLPRMTKQEAAGVTFFGHDLGRAVHYDISTTPEFVLGFISFFFIFLLLAVVFITDSNEMVMFMFFGQEWAIWVFGLLGFIIVFFVGISIGTSRAFFLMNEQLLSEYASKAYLFVKQFKLPFILAASSELLVICSGLFLYASTGSTFIFELACFGPIIMMLTLVVFAQWVKNDFRLVIWPPEDEEDAEDNGDEFDEEAEYEREAEALRDSFVLPSLRNVGGGEDENIDVDSSFRMPSLPFKGALMKNALKTKGDNSSILPHAASRESDLEAQMEVDEDIDAAEEIAKSAENESENVVKIDINVDDAQKQIPLEDKVIPSKFNLKGKKNLSALLAKFCKCFTRNKQLKYKEVSERPRLDSTNPEVQSYSGNEGDSLLQNDPEEINFEEMSLYQAFRQGYLLQEDYIVLGCFGMLLFMIFLFGVVVSVTEKPSWFGNLIWVLSYILLFSVSPIIKWFHVLEITLDMKISAIFSFTVAWISGFVIFFVVMKASVNDVESLVILSLLVLYPFALLFCATLYKWKDDEWAISPFIRLSLSLCIFMIVLWIVEMFIWGGIAFGGVLTFTLVVFILALFFMSKWIENEFYLAPYYQKRISSILLSSTIFFVILGLIFGVDIFYCTSIALIIVMIKLAGSIIGTRMTREPEIEIFYSPYIFPIFSYDAKTNDVNNENYEMKCLYTLFLAMFCWGTFGVMFANPLGFGIGLCSLVLLCFAGTSAYLCSVTPLKMGLSSKYVNDAILQEAAEVAKDCFRKRREQISLECAEFIEKDRREREEEIQFQKLSLGVSHVKSLEKEDDNINEIAERKCAAELALKIDDNLWKCKYTMFENKEVRRPDSLMHFKDIFVEIVRAGKGPFGFLSLFGIPYMCWTKVTKQVDTKVYNRDGSLINQLEKDSSVDIDLVDSIEYLLELPNVDKELDLEFFEETRCIIHFQLLVMNAAEARIGRERILFQKFLRENRFKLMSNGISPPSNIFKTNSFASIDIPLVAVWLISLTPEERERFNILKSSFTEDMERKDEIIDAEDEQSRFSQDSLLKEMKYREDIMCRRRFQEFQARRIRREEEGIEIPAGKDEALINTEEAISEIESGWSCNPGQFGRSLQFVDPDFPPDESSIAGCSAEEEIVEWKVSTGININAGLFDGGTDPDDVNHGQLNDVWLLSAISIIAASGGVDDGKVDALIDQLFITKQTSLTGAYAIRFYKNSQWESVIVDDYFPVLDSSYNTEPCAGVAFGYSKNFEELWVPLLEKAYAKYQGGYATLEYGFVHHALNSLTGYEAEEVFLSQASRGAKKKQLWKQIFGYKKNNFLMGAGTISSDNADQEILDTGLVFGACYVIYDVRVEGNNQLIKLRNPPGDHAEWQGDWGDDSPMWNRRFKKRLGWSDEDDNTFWMSFEDFCNAFRCLYVCHYYDPTSWTIKTLHGKWDDDTAAGLPTKHCKDCALDTNPQYTLGIRRPTEVVVSVVQVDEGGLANPETHPFAVFIVKSNQADRAIRVKSLTRDNVVASTGPPVRERQLVLKCTLPARTYTILVAPYVKGMKGPFKMTIQTNFNIDLEQLWPPPWREPKVPTTVAEKMAAKVKEKVNESGAMAKLQEKKNQYKNKIIAGAAVLDNAMVDDEELLRREIEEEEAKVLAETKKKKKSPWVEQWDDTSGKPFYFNKKTGVSSWDKPDDF